MFIKRIILAVLLFLPSAAKALDVDIPDPIRVPNPVNAESIPQLSGDMTKGLLGVTGAIALFMMVWGGIVWMTSNGNAERVKRGKDTLLWSILGLVIIFMSYVVIRFVFTLIDPQV